ncbi:hypothetical protein TNCV_2354971 [Trichonephila clavipes]|nr:hypothetical protein TNCV_2354971 [Trichonephila clavipes]
MATECKEVRSGRALEGISMDVKIHTPPDTEDPSVSFHKQPYRRNFVVRQDFKKVSSSATHTGSQPDQKIHREFLHLGWSIEQILKLHLCRN